MLKLEKGQCKIDLWLDLWLVFCTHRLILPGHTSRPADFSWALNDSEIWHLASVSEDNIVMVWQPTMRIWAGENVKVDENELEGDPMEGVEFVEASGSASGTGAGAGTGSTGPVAAAKES